MNKQLWLLLLSMTLLQTSYAKTALISGQDVLTKASTEIQNIKTDDLQSLLNKNPDVVLIDVRLATEVDSQGGAIKAPQNVNIPRGWLEFRVADFVITQDTPIVVYCGTNLRSPLAVKALMDMGYSNVRNYSDGVVEWNKRKLPQRLADSAPDSILFNKPEKVIDGVWSAIGETGPATIENSGHNNNLSFVVGDDSVLVMNAGGSYLLAQALHQEIKKITDKPVKYVVLENAQGHAILGSDYWQSQGAKVIAQTHVVEEIKEFEVDIFDRARARLQDKLAHTKVVMPDETFEESMDIDLGNKKISLQYLGSAHGPGDIVLWMPEEKLVITGDVAFHERLLPIFETTNTSAWLETWKKLEALKAKVVIPGHGGPTNMTEVTKYTKTYLEHMRNEIAKMIDAGKSSADAYGVNQSDYKHLDTYEQLYRRNAARIFAEMEFE